MCKAQPGLLVVAAATASLLVVDVAATNLLAQLAPQPAGFHTEPPDTQNTHAPYQYSQSGQIALPSQTATPFPNIHTTHATPRMPIPPVAANGGGTAEAPETLEQAWARALALDPLVEADRLDAASAEDRLRAARAERLPSLGLDVGYIVRDNMPAFRLDSGNLPVPVELGPLATNQREALQAGTVARLPLYTSGRIRSGIDAAAAKVDSAKLQVTSTAMDLKLRVAAAYVGVLRGERNLGVADSTITSLAAHLQDVSLLHQYHQVPRNDVLAAGVELANARQDRVRAFNGLDAAQAAYNRLLQRPLDQHVRLAGLPRPVLMEDLQTLTQRAVTLRPVLGDLTAQMRALQEQAEAVRASRKPQFDLRGRYLFEENRFRTPEGIASVAVGMHWDAIDGGRSRHEAHALLQQAARVGRIRADVESEIRLEVRRAWLDVQEADHRIEITREAVSHAAENLRIARERYAAGTGTNTEVLDAVMLQTVTERNLYDAVYDAALALLRLRRATGEL